MTIETIIEKLHEPDWDVRWDDEDIISIIRHYDPIRANAIMKDREEEEEQTAATSGDFASCLFWCLCYCALFVFLKVGPVALFFVFALSAFAGLVYAYRKR